MYFRKKTSCGRAYLRIVESRREGSAVRQQVIATLGRLDELRGSGQRERRPRSGARFAHKAIVLETVAAREATASEARRIGPALVFERLWREAGCRAAVEGLGLHHLDRAMGWLGEELDNQQEEATPFAPRCPKDVPEEELFARRRDLFTSRDLVFMDTTRLYFEGAGGQTLGRRGFSKDHRPDLNQRILAVLLDGDDRPACTEMWRGNTADVTRLIPAVDRLRKRFSINWVCVVADRGMIGAETIAELEARKLLYILGVRERGDKRVRELVLDDPAPFVPFFLTKRKMEIDYEVKAATLAGRRYVARPAHLAGRAPHAGQRAGNQRLPADQLRIRDRLETAAELRDRRRDPKVFALGHRAGRDPCQISRRRAFHPPARAYLGVEP
jgi:hypothetical protein